MPAASNLDNCFLKSFCSVSVLSSVIPKSVASLQPPTRVPLMVWLIVWVYFLLGQSNDLRFVGGEDDAPFITPVCDCCVEDLYSVPCFPSVSV